MTRLASGVLVRGIASLGIAWLAASAAEEKPPESEYGTKPYRFTSDWHSHAIPSWRKALAPYVGRPGLRYLEIGTFQGRSFFWILENVATDPTSRLTGIDIITSNIQENLAISGAADRIEILEGRSADVLRSLSGPYQIVYIDGSHRGDDVLADTVLTWGLLEVGGTLIFDDYRWHTKPGPLSTLVLPPELRPQESIDFFVTTYRDEVEIVDRGFQLIVRKRAPLCAGFDTRYCSPIGAYVYDWEHRVVRDPATREALDLTPNELKLVEQLILGLAPGEVRVFLPAAMRARPIAKRLAAKLRLSP